MPGSEYVIKYISDYTDAISGAQELERINAEMSDTISGDFQQAIKIIGTSLDKITEVPIKLKGGEDAIKTVSQLGTVIQTSDGSFREFIKTQTFINGELEKTQGSLKDVTSQFHNTEVSLAKLIEKQQDMSSSQVKLVGTSSQLATNFKSLDDVSLKFSQQLDGFGKVSKIAGGELTKVSDNTFKFTASAEMANGQLLKLTETVTRTSDGLQTVSRSAQLATKPVSNLQGTSSQLATNFKSLYDVTVKFQQQLTEFAPIANIVSSNLTKVSNTSKQTDTVIRTTDGRFLKLTETVKRTSDGLQTVDRSVKDTTSAMNDSSKSTESLAENIYRLAKRAILTIPLWMALRGVMMGTFRSITDGIKAIEDQDRSWQKARGTLQGTVADIARDFSKLKEATTALSIETGESIEKITKAFYKFSTVGFDFETSMKGAEYATKTAIVMFGEAEETANVFARAMRVLVDNSADAKPAGEQIAEAMALTAKLWETNAFELNEFTQSLEKFSGVAKSTNFTTQQSITLLASLSTAGMRGGRAGTQLRTSVLKLLQNLDKLSGVLGVKVNPQLDSTFDVLMRVLDAVEGLDKGSKVAQQTATMLGEIFGGIRGLEAVLALKALREEMLKNFQIAGGIDDLDESYERVEDTISRLVDKYHNLNREIGKTFVTAVIGGDDFKESLDHITTDTLPKMKDYLEEAGILVNKLAKYNLAAPFGYTLDYIKQISIESAKLFEDINLGLTGKLDRKQLINVLAKIKISTEDNLIEVSPQTVIALENKLMEATEKISITPEIDVEQTVTRKVLTAGEQQDISKEVLKVELDRLRVLGATNSQILKAEELYTKQLGIEEASLDKVRRKLEYEKAINEERRLQNKLGGDSVKLFEIAQKEGTDIAKEIGDVLAGETDFSRFVRKGGKELEIFKREFEDTFKQQQAVAFFKGDTVPGEKGLRGGYGIAIEEEAIRRPVSRFDPRLAVQQNRTEREFQRTEELKVQIESPITINANIDISQLSEVQQAFVDKVALQLPQVGSKINKALAQALGNKQNQVV